MAPSINSYQHIFFIGVAGAGMSAIAQYLAGTGKEVSGSDRYFVAGEVNETRSKLEAEGIVFCKTAMALQTKHNWLWCQQQLKIPLPKCKKPKRSTYPF
ncbi:MAG TPA: Mur ligase domain-containing protein [Ferruginibacter sp.]|nr:Mur ligase domain-containing protein [Ferruginibacter sp.]